MPLALLLLGVAPGAAAYATLFAPTTTRGGLSSSPFSTAGLATHSTGLLDDVDVGTCPAPGLPQVLEVAAQPRALPKRAAPEPEIAPSDDPLGLWSRPPSPGGPQGPNVFKLNQGRAIDILRSDYPQLFDNKPDLSIFTEKMELHDSSGRRLKGIKQYAKVFDMLRFLRRTTMQDAQLTYRLVVVDERIRVRWTAKLWLRDPALGLTKMANGEPIVVHLDGVSNYHLDSEGKIYKHVLENIVMNGPSMAEPVQLALSWPSLGLATPELAYPAPFHVHPIDVAKGWAPPKELAALFAPTPPPQQPYAASEASASDAAPSQQPTPQQPIAAQPARRRSGPPQAMAAGEPPADETPMERAARERAEDAEKARQLSELRAPKETASKGFFGLTMPQACESSYDCESGLHCCDLLFGSICCSGGVMIPTREREGVLQRQAIPIPVERDDPVPPGHFPGPGRDF